jgi:ADP-heptose:LPS heptosyltransferase/GT2 family glycosyltransferase
MKFTISVLAYQNLPLTRRCLESVIANSTDFELILTDNGCKDGTAEYFDELHARNPEIVTVFHNPRNEGFINPNRRAFGIARGRFFVLLNNDTVVPKGWLETLEAAFLINPDCALSGPAGSCCQLRADFHGEMGPRFEYLEGSCLMMDVAKVRELEPNLFPPELIGAYGEDSYLSLRVRGAGYSIQRVPLVIQHVRAATSVMVPQCREWQANNHAFLQRRFAKYIKGHRFDYPIILRRRAAWGDVLLMTPIIRALKERNRMCRIEVETICPDVFNANPDVSYVDRQVLVNNAATEDHNLNGISEMKPSMHIVDAYAECVGLRPGEYDKVTRLYVPQGDTEWALRTVGVESWVAIHPGPTAWPCKNWNLANWPAVIKAIQEMGYKVALVGNDVLPGLPCDFDLRKKTNVGQLGALLHECKLFVGVDSFPIHVAQAVGTPVVGLFGITRPELILTDGSMWSAVSSPPDHTGTGLRHKKPGTTRVDCPENPMDAISIEAVTAEIDNRLQCKIHA